MVNLYTPVQFDITGEVPGITEPLEIAAWIFSPKGPVRGVFYCLPGGSYTKAYYHLAVRGYLRGAYSFALDMAQRGWLVIAVDHLGTGESSRPKQEDLLTMERIAVANDAVVKQINNGLLTGTLLEDIPPFQPPTIIGVGHSMGGMLAIAQQAYRNSFDALAILGWSNRRISFGGVEIALAQMAGNKNVESSEEAARLAGLSLSPQEARVPVSPFFYAPDVPKSVIKADSALATTMPRGILLEMDASRRVKDLAATKIDIPVFVGFGTTDVSDDLQAEATTYPRSPEVTTFHLLDSAHCHNFASSRNVLWDRMNEWGEHLVEPSVSKAS